MNGDAWTEKVVVEIRALEGPNWRDRAEWLVAQAGRACAQSEIGESAYIRIYEAAEKRKDRTAEAQARHEYRVRKEDSLYGFVSEHTVDLEEPAPPPSPPAVVSKIRAGVRGPSRHTPEERHERIRYLRRQADMAKLPADLSAEYSRAELSVISNVLFVIHESAAGACELALEALAARARVSKRCVQDAIAIAKRLGHLLVERRGPKPSRITVLMPRIQKWLNGPDANLLMEKIEELLEVIKSPSHVADICHSSSPNPSQNVQEGPRGVPAKVGAVSRPRPPMGLETNPGGMRAAWDAMLDRANAIVAAAARSRTAPS